MKIIDEDYLVEKTIGGRSGYWLKSAVPQDTETQEPAIVLTTKKAPGHTPGEMNAGELWYYENVLLPGVAAGDFQAVSFERLIFVLAFNTPGGKSRVSYTPDFAIITADGRTELHEVKREAPPKPRNTKKPWTSMREDAHVKVKMAAELFPWYVWKVIYVCLPLQKWREETL